MAVRELTDGEKAELNAQPGVLSRLAIGSNLQEMQRAINAGGGGEEGAFPWKVKLVTADTTLTLADQGFVMQMSGTITLPPSAPDGTTFFIFSGVSGGGSDGLVRVSAAPNAINSIGYNYVSFRALHVVARNTSGILTWYVANAAGQPYAKIVDKKSSGVDGGTFTSGAWQTRTLNVIDTDEDSIVTSLSANRFKLVAGTYYVSCRAPAREVYRHRLALYNVTGGNYPLYGQSNFAHAAGGVEGFAATAGIIHTDGTAEYELRHRCETTVTTNGFGVASGFGVDEIYSTVEIFGRSPA